MMQEKKHWYEELEDDISKLKKRVDAFDPGSGYELVIELWRVVELLKSEVDGLRELKEEFDDKWKTSWDVGKDM